MAEASVNSQQNNEYDTDDDWDYRSRSSSIESVHQFTRQRSLDDDSSLDMSFLSLNSESFIAYSKQFQSDRITTINISGNRLSDVPINSIEFPNLQMLDLSQNELTYLSDKLCQLQLTSLIVANNHLNDDSLPKDFGVAFARSLRVLSLGGNKFRSIPTQILELKSLKTLYFGDNAIESIPKDIQKLESLRVLYLGGNQLESIPVEVGKLQHLEMLSLCENQLRSLPSTIAQLRNLRSLALHRNQLTTLPPEIVKLRGLIELSLRNNPLVMRFVRDMMYDPPSLLELAARSIKVNKVNYNSHELPQCLNKYMATGHRCVNPKCKGVYFDSRVEHIKFVDFCGSFRIPLLQYLCSPLCSSLTPAIKNSSDESESDTNDISDIKLKRVLLG